MFEDILGRQGQTVEDKDIDLKDINESTVIVCPECGIDMMSLIFDGDDDFNLVDNDYPCKQCAGEE